MRNIIHTISMIFSHIFLTLRFSAFVTNVKAICSWNLKVIDIPIKTVHDKQTSVTSYCHTIGFPKTNLQNTDKNINTDKNPIRKTVINVAILSKTSLTFPIITLILFHLS